MADVRLAVIFYSTYGTNHAMAEVAADAGREAGADVRLLRVAETAPASVVSGQEKWKVQADKVAHIPEVSVADMEWANAYLISAPTRYGVSASQLRAFIDTLGPIWQQGKLANKVFSAMTSASNPHGGQETTLIGLYTTAMHWGAVLVPPGYTDPAVSEAGGNPYGTTTVGVQDGVLPDGVQKAIRHQARRLVEIGRKVAA
jgi:NAD(P)H dehydrogenase (quinone)